MAENSTKILAQVYPALEPEHIHPEFPHLPPGTMEIIDSPTELALGQNESVVIHSGGTLDYELNDIERRITALAMPVATFSGASSSSSSRDCSPAPQMVQAPEPPTAVRKFKALARRSFRSADLAVIEAQSERICSDFYPDTCFTPFQVSQGVYKVVQSNPPLRDPQVHRAWTLVSHGILSHEWSLIPDISRLIVHPIATIETPTGHSGEGQAIINDLSIPELAQSISVVIFSDAWTCGHIEFMMDEDYRYIWSYSRAHDEYNLIQLRIADGLRRIAARISNRSLFRSPMDDSLLWTFEVDVDRINPAVGFLSAFVLKQHSPLLALHSLLSLKPNPTPPRPLVDAAFADEGRIFQRSSKFYSDWEEDSPSSSEETRKVRLIRVFSHAYLENFFLPDVVVRALDRESSEEVERLRIQFGLA